MVNYYLKYYNSNNEIEFEITKGNGKVKEFFILMEK